MEEENKQEVKNVEVAETLETNKETINRDSNQNNTLALTSMILGIVSIVLMCVYGIMSWISAILAIVFGIISIKSESKNMAIAGIVTGIIVIALNVILIILSFIGFGLLATMI